jgi:K+-transporting ATPase KdpF subunit
MSWGDIGLLVLSAFVFAYLLVALIKPDQFG